MTNSPAPLVAEEVAATLIEQLADAEHASWARWMKYLFSCCDEPIVRDRMLTVIPLNLVRRWKRQAATPYAALSEGEKEADRDEVRHILPLIESALRAERQAGIHWALREMTTILLEWDGGWAHEVTEAAARVRDRAARRDAQEET